ncbi:monocarboxylate transporter 13-like [Amphiura filiformis]|uniref:monocarboxylate transporter 13-like n=1 Tax=Amphiura filiformis TaxID=82378 RepID=UPI003B228819
MVYAMANVMAKDRGWAWIITLTSFIATALLTGTVKSLGVMLPTLRQQFSTQTWVIGLSISLTTAFGVVTCPLAGALSKRLTPRHTVMIFSILAVLGLIMAALATAVQFLIVALLLTGFSVGAHAVIIGEEAIYFEKYYNISMAISQAGLSLGIMVMPPMTQLLLYIYGWRGSMLLLAALNLHLIVCGALLKPFHTGRVELEDNELIKRSKKQQEHENLVITNLVHYLDLTLFTDADFVAMLVYILCCGYCFTGWLIYLVPHAMELGFQSYESSFLATIGGFGNLLAAILYPILKICTPDKTTLYLTTLMSTFALGLDPLVSSYHSYIGLAILSCIYVLARGMAILSVFKMVKNVVDDNKMTNAMLWMNFADGIGGICSGFFSGWTFDVTGSFMLSSLLLSAISLLGLCPQFIVDMRSVWKARKYASRYNNHHSISILTKESIGNVTSL